MYHLVHMSSEVFSVLPDDLQCKKTSPRNSACDYLQGSATTAQRKEGGITQKTKGCEDILLCPSEQWV